MLKYLKDYRIAWCFAAFFAIGLYLNDLYNREQWKDYKCWAYKLSIWTVSYANDFTNGHIKETVLSGPWEKVWVEKYLQQDLDKLSKDTIAELAEKPIVFRCPCNEDFFKNE